MIVLLHRISGMVYHMSPPSCNSSPEMDFKTERNFAIVINLKPALRAGGNQFPHT